MNNNLLFLGLAAGGLWYLTRTKTSAPAVLADNLTNGYATRPAIGSWVQAANGRWYPSTTANTTTGAGTGITLTPATIIKDATTVISTVKDTWGTIKDIFDGDAKSTASVTTSTPTSVKSSVVSSVPTTGFAAGETYGDGGSGIKDFSVATF